MHQLLALAIWNAGGDYWMTSQKDIFGHSVVYSATLPPSGSMRNGELYARPMLALPTIEPESSCSPGPQTKTPAEFSKPKTKEKMLPTPKASDGLFGTPKTSGRPAEKSTHLQTIVVLLPKPGATDGMKGARDPEVCKARRHQVNLIDAIRHRSILVSTPPQSNAGND